MILKVFIIMLVLSFYSELVLGGRYGGGYESYGYGYSGWKGGHRKPFGLYPGGYGYGGHPHFQGPGWRGNYPVYGPGAGGYGYPGYGYGNYGGGAISTASASASAGGGGPFGGLSHSSANSHTASINLGPLSATFSKSQANANALGK